MSRRLKCVLVTAAAAVALLSGCDPSNSSTHSADKLSAAASTTGTAANPSHEPSAAPDGQAGASSKARDPWLLTAAGIGPYKIGTKPAANLMTEPHAVDTAQCPTVFTYETTGRYNGTLQLLLKDGVLVQIGTAGGEPHTAEGASMGDSLARIKKLYGARAVALTGEGGLKGMRVVSGGNALIFAEGPPHREGVAYITIGRTDTVTHRFTEPNPCV